MKYSLYEKVFQVSIVFCSVFLSTSPLVSMAKTNGDSTNYSFSGRLIDSTPCTVNNDQIIDVSFGKVAIGKVDTGQYIKNINYTLDCHGAASNATVKMKLSATAAGWDSSAITTNVTGLGVHILNNCNAIKLNTDIAVTPDTPLQLQAQLVKDPTATLAGQDFVATGTLTAEYI